jgi:tetratricopeptide (TPR) repeat protein
LRKKHIKATEPTGRHQNLQTVCICIFLVLAVLMVFGQTANFKFVNYDDDTNVYENAAVAKGLSLHAIGWAFTHAQVGDWIPLTTLSHMMDCQFFGLDAGGHHLVNVLLHAANAVLLFLMLRQMTGSPWRSAFVAAVFAVHPLRAESVAWVSERKDVLSAFFFMLTIGAYVRNVRKPSRAGNIVMVLLFALGLMAKSMVATLPFVLLLLDYWPLKRFNDSRQFLRLAAEKIPLFVLSAAACVATALTPNLIITTVSDRLPLMERLGNAVVSYAVYMRQMVFPAGLAIPYPYATHGQPIWKISLAFVLLAVISAYVFACRKKRPFLLMGWLWYLGMLIPVIGIIQISFDSAHADRYTYLPEIGLAIAGTWFVADWSAGLKYRRTVSGGLMIPVIGALTICGHIQTSYWKDGETLWTRTLDCNSANVLAINNLGVVISSNGNLEKGIAQYRKALEINPDYAEARYNLGVAMALQGNMDEAITQYRKALEIQPDYAEARNNLGTALFTKGFEDEAIVQFQKSLQIQPDYADAHYNLGNALLKHGKLDEAIAQYRTAVEINPDYTEAHYNLGVSLVVKGSLDEAIVQYRKALETAPDNALIHNNLGTALFAKGFEDDAMTQFQKALQLQPDYAEAHYNLGNVLLKHDKLDEAIAQYRTALDINPAYAEASNNLRAALSLKQNLDRSRGATPKSSGR